MLVLLAYLVGSHCQPSLNWRTDQLVPVRFDSVEYNGKDQVTIIGMAASDQDILKLIENLGKQKLIKQASLSSMKLPGGQGAQKGFKIFVKVKGI